MLTFFRKIRRSLLDSGAAQKYVLYAVGEILLVMIGILLALQVNNWNESERSKRIERQLLVGLKAELGKNQEILNESLLRWQGYLGACSTVLSLFDDWEETPSSVIDSVVARVSAGWMFNPRFGLLKSIISSGEIGHISNQELVARLSEFDDMVFDVKETTDAAGGIWRNQLSPLISEYLPLNNAFRARRPSWSGQPESHFDSDYAGFFGSRVIEGRIAHMNAYIQHAVFEKTDLMSTMEEMKEMIEGELGGE